jgi:hypothetical protein
LYKCFNNDKKLNNSTIKYKAKVKGLNTGFHSSKKERSNGDIDESIAFQFITVKRAKQVATLHKLCPHDVAKWDFSDYLVNIISLHFHLYNASAK